jgi:hypothetical protein
VVATVVVGLGVVVGQGVVVGPGPGVVVGLDVDGMIAAISQHISRS